MLPVGPKVSRILKLLNESFEVHSCFHQRCLLSQNVKQYFATFLKDIGAFITRYHYERRSVLDYETSFPLEDFKDRRVEHFNMFLDGVRCKKFYDKSVHF